MKPRPTLVLLVTLALGMASPVRAQLSGEHALLSFGIKSATQAPPGIFLAPTWFYWDVDNIVGRDGGKVPIDLQVNSLALFAWIVTPKKLLGGTYGFQAIVPLVSNALELPRLGYQNSIPLGLGDIYLMPVNLGWHTPRADFMAGLALYFPTGTYEPSGNANLGMGMWSFEISGGSTLYFDRGQKWSLSALGYYEMHTSKEDQDLTPGSILTIEGGLGGTFLKGALSAGLAYGAQWKMTDDSGDEFPSDVLPGRNHLYTLGPEVSFTGFYKPPWLISLTARYLWDVGASSSFEGSRFIVFATVGRLHLPGAGATAP